MCMHVFQKQNPHIDSDAKKGGLSCEACRGHGPRREICACARNGGSPRGEEAAGGDGGDGVIQREQRARRHHNHRL